ncbi:hypothetical protein [Clostridium saccharobutylicum]|uniref:Ricin B lectin n=1 Tax=Clostridium saccharobutylicum DSM 13864 TaxID=1345695 RepID=U5MSY2_CLOSA|nr:hypothetical protein [Clostridium saccharobutylicum]AGX43638.1 ricin B lectin [Clostridium saccharobutylicum DSM 13864]AQR90936.1 hypothetical protein CLOSC_26570 [Clostridium saccharobutylicum]AQS00840.1 hypothetical protein CSACC_26640 [Clostridium saccharobutylicum]AQS14823.1 hypothetical protein CLOSACC_26640 [Clostridium saccharobutylicum]MBA2905912.1 hypothetical protein [Clostridium saccharobutylicum]
MKKIKLTKVIASTLMVASILALNPIRANAEWRKDSKGWWYAVGNSYYKNQWKQIGGDWYYFGYNGYLVQNRIEDGYYLNSDGAWATGSEEIQAYAKILTNPRLLKDKYGLSIPNSLIKSNTSYSADIVDINKDGIYEALVGSETSHADAKTSVFTYKNGNIQFAGDLGNDVYYSEKQNVLLGSVMFQGNQNGGVYKLEDGKLIKVHSFELINNLFKESYVIDGESVTKEQSNKFFEQYGENNMYIRK